MKRANQLQPLSRQHHLGLHVARHARECANNSEEITKHWQALTTYLDDMNDHFNIEDNILAQALLPHKSKQPEVAAVLNTLDIQHKLLHELVAEVPISQETDASNVTVNQVQQLAIALYDHIRFEERELLPMAEIYLTEEDLNAIYNASPDDIKHLDEQR